MRRSASSNPIPGSLSESVGKLGGGLGFEGSPDFVPGDLGPVGEALAFDAFKGCVRALHIVDSKSSPIIPAEIELRRVALQVLFAHAVEGAVQAALEDRARQ